MSSLDSFCGLCKELVNLASHASQDPGAFYLTKDACFHQTAPSCPLCELLRYAFAQQHGEAALRAWDIEELLPHPVSITFNYSRVPQDEDRCSEANLVLGNRDVTLALWAHEQGTTAATTFVTRPQIADSHSGQPVHLIRSLLQDCLQNHDRCAHSKASDLPVADHDAHLPTRVLDIRPGPDPDLPTVRLLETNGARGQYCALSHCWGPPEKRPLRTLHSNLAHHLNDIPFARLPTTFREAALFTLRLGIRYLWIDSLCIVQDDREDWAKEAQVMGALYQGALLVIAAAGASDSTRGLFVSDRAQLRQIRVPFLSSKSNADEPPGAFYISTVPKGQFDPDMSILRERGWVYQEWYLARRIVFSMPGGLVWRCAEYNLDELGVHTPHETELNESRDWYQLLRGYTSKKLTYASDRLDALWGISEEVKKRLGGGNLWDNFKNGVWDSSLMTHLLWKTVARPTEGQDDLPNLPSWTWAATGAEKDWVLRPYRFERRHDIRELPKSLRMTDNQGALAVESGTTVTLGLQKSPIDHDQARRIEYYWEGASGQAEKTLDRIRTKSCSYPCYLVRERRANQIVGLAVFDKDFVDDVVCFLLASVQRLPGDPLHADGRLEEHHRVKWERSAIRSDIGRQLHEAAVSTLVYWAVLMVPAPGHSAAFKRVGLGLLYPSARERGQEVTRSFAII